MTERLKALADESRLRMLDLLSQHGDALCVCEITEQFDLRQPTISHHLRLLREAALIRGKGAAPGCITPPPMRADGACLWSEPWCDPLYVALFFCYIHRRFSMNEIHERTDIPMSDDQRQQNTQDATTITDLVRERYASAARRVRAGGGAGGCCGDEKDAVTSDLYAAADVAALPEEAVLASFGCGNPTALIDLHEGETVLDLGSGGGIDVLLSARRVGPSGFAYGLDMTDEMLALAQENKAKAGASNVAFLKGRIEEIPLPANSVDVVISNCVINLGAEKGLVLREAFRVLKPGGRFAVSDVVADGPVPDALRRNMEAWVGCLAGALDLDEYTRLLTDAGFEESV